MKQKKLTGIKLFLFAFFAVTVFLPLIFMLRNIGDADMGQILSSQQFQNGLKNSLLLAFCATIISLVLATVLAFCIERSQIRHKNLLTFLLTLPMLIPSISHGMGLVILFGQNGFLTNLLGLDFSIYGFGGVLTGSVLYSFPVAFLMMLDVIRYEDCSSYDAADILGIPKVNQFLRITLPYLRKPLINIAFAVFTLVITDYGVPLMVGGKFSTLPVVMYEEVIGLLNFDKGSVIGLILLIPATLAFVIDLFCQDRGVHSYVVAKKNLTKNKVRDALAKGFCILVCLFVALPIVAFCLLSVMKKYPVDISLSLDNILKSFQMGAGNYLINALIIAAFVTVLGTVISYLTAYLTARTPGVSSRALHLFSITSMAIPGMVLGLSYALVYKGSFLYGTLAILIMVNLTHFFSSPYLIAYNSFNKVNKNMESVAVTLGVNRFYLLKDVLIPQMKGTILEMLSYFFVNCMMTISAVSFLFTTKTMPISLMITQFEAQMLIECSAFVSIIILGVNVFVKCLLTYLRNRQARKEELPVGAKIPSAD